MALVCVAFSIAAQYAILPHSEIPYGTSALSFNFYGSVGTATIILPRGGHESEVVDAAIDVHGLAESDPHQIVVIQDSYSEYSIIGVKGWQSHVPIHVPSGTGLKELKIAVVMTPRTDNFKSALEAAINLQLFQTALMVVVPSVQHRLFVGLAVFTFAYLVLLGLRYAFQSKQQQEHRLEQKVEQAESKAQAEPEKAKYAWDVARINLEAYFERNRTQVSQVFIIAVIVMFIGFILVCFGVYLAMTRPDTIKPALVAGISGIITQFIGATFMVIYKSTMTQANEFMVILERINTVGMAVQVLDSIPEGEVALKNQSRTKIVELLLSANISTAKAKTKKSRAATA